jgi:hypothetical protein
MPVQPSRPNITPPAYNASGTVVTSGIPVSSSYDGPWFVEEQGLNIDYHRVPQGSLSAFDLDLSSISVTERHNHTVLIAEVKAYYRSYKDWNTYDTSAWQQPQTFAFLSFSADTQGNSYGDLTASTLGPMGSIITDQPFYNRRLWSAASGDAEVNKSCDGTTYYAVQYPNSSFSGTVDQTAFNDDFEYFWINSTRDGTLLSDWDVAVWHDWLYSIPGTYATNKEDLWKIFQYIDQIGNIVSWTRLYSIPAKMVATGVDSDQGFAEYRITRHDYS